MVEGALLGLQRVPSGNSRVVLPLLGELTAAFALRCVQGPVALSEQVNQRAATAGRRCYVFVCRLRELEATSGIEPEYTVLQTVA